MLLKISTLLSGTALHHKNSFYHSVKRCMGESISRCIEVHSISEGDLVARDIKEIALFSLSATSSAVYETA